jgi:serine protease Do
MHTRAFCAAVLACAFLIPVVHASDKISTPIEKASRSTPLVKAIEKTKPGVVAIRVPRQGEKDMVGAGLIVDESGLILTNRHVTGGKSKVKIRLHDGTDLEGAVVRSDSDLDLAIIKIDTQKKLTVLPLAPDDMMVGEDVFAIGSPYGYDATVSRGIISALNREITMPNDVLMTGLIQHDAPINPGNSGGPLINVNAEVIGINVAMRDGAQNIAFAINAGTVKGFLSKHLQRTSSVQHGLTIEEKVVAEVGDRQRVVVKTAHAELKSGDEIRTVGATRIANALDVQRALWAKQPGQQVEVKVMRQGAEVSVMLTLEASPGAGLAATASALPSPSGRGVGNDAAANQSVRPATER